jgi:hypothetical protein
MHSNITTQEVLAHATERSEKIAQAGPHSFNGIGMYFKYIAIIIITSLFLEAVDDC